MRPIISIEKLGYTYPNGIRALDGIDLTIYEGERLAVLGSNGSGKSTLFLCINGVLRVQSGAIQFQGEPIRYDKKSLLALRRKVGIVFQDPETQLFCVDVFQEVAFGPYNLGHRGERLEQTVMQQLDALDLVDLRTSPPQFLSGGQKKRVSIAAVLAMRPQIIIFDEPTAALDPIHAKQMLALLERLSEEGLTVIVSTHDVDMAYAWADRAVVMKQGKICAAAAPHEIFSDLSLLEQSDLCQPAVLRIFEKLIGRRMLPRTLPPPRTVEQLTEYLEKRGR